jgi:hypothetical protein
MIHEAFAREVSRENVFMDVVSISPGANFRKLLKDWVAQCDVLLALIGPDWINATDPLTGKRRLENPSDFVRIEIGEALARDIPVVPVLLDGAPLPDADQLPGDLKELCDRQAEFIEYRTFDTDVQSLIKKLRLGASPSGDTVTAAFANRGEQLPAERPPLPTSIKGSTPITKGPVSLDPRVGTALIWAIVGTLVASISIPTGPLFTLGSVPILLYQLVVGPLYGFAFYYFCKSTISRSFLAGLFLATVPILWHEIAISR